MAVFQTTFIAIASKLVLLCITEEVACADPILCEEICNNKAGCYDIAYPLLVLRILPTGIMQSVIGLSEHADVGLPNSLTKRANSREGPSNHNPLDRPLSDQ